MQIHNNVFCLDNLLEKKDKVLQKIRDNKNIGLYYLITVPPSQHQIEMFRYLLDKQNCFDIKDHIVVGIASNYDDGIAVIEMISRQVYQKQRDLDYKRFFNV